MLRFFGHAAANDAALLHDAEGDHVDQAVVVEAGVEERLAAVGGDTERVTVLRDAVDHAECDVAHARRVGSVGVAEAKRIHHADHVGAHAVHVAYDAADAGRGSLDRQHLRRVVVALVRHDEAVALPADLRRSE